MAIDVKNMVQFYQGATLPQDAVNHPNRVYFIKNGEVGSLYKGGVLIAQTNNDATIKAIEKSVTDLSGEFDQYVTDHTALYNALVKVVQENGAAITVNEQAIAGIKNGTAINDFATVENALAGKEEKGAAAAAQSAAKDYTDAEVAKANQAAATADGKADKAQEAADKAQEAADKAQEAADQAQDEVDALETYVGTIPTTSQSKDIIQYIQEKTSGIASDQALQELTGRVAENERDILAIEGKLVDIESTVVAEISAEVAAEKERAEGIESGLDSRIKAVEDDYLKAADKTELTGAIATAKQEAIDAILGGAVDEDFDTLKEVSEWILSDTTGAAALQTDVATIKADYLKSTDKTELEGKITAASNAAGTAQTAADKAQGEVDALEEVVETLSGVVDTKAAAADLTALTGRVTTAEGEIDTLQSEMDAVEAKAAANEGAIATANAEIAKKANQTDFDALEGRVGTAETDIDNLQAELDTATTGVKARLTAVEGKADGNASDIADLLAALEWHQA